MDDPTFDLRNQLTIDDLFLAFDVFVIFIVFDQTTVKNLWAKLQKIMESRRQIRSSLMLVLQPQDIKETS